MTALELKQANRLFWMVKGRLVPNSWSDETIQDMVRDYTKRLWYNEEAYIYEEGFEEAWQKVLDKSTNLVYK